MAWHQVSLIFIIVIHAIRAWYCCRKSYGSASMFDFCGSASIKRLDLILFAVNTTSDKNECFFDKLLGSFLGMNYL